MKTQHQINRGQSELAAEIVAEAAKAAAKTVIDTAAATASLLGNDINYMKKDISVLQADMKKILENHLPHLKEDISALSTQIKMFTLVNIGGIILGIVATWIIKQ